jgi:ATP-dependent Clp protease ATP-binding subunit ClpA
MRIGPARRPALRDPSTRMLDLAGAEAQRLRHTAVGTEHLLLACLYEAEPVLEQLGLSPEELRAELEERFGDASRREHEALAAIGIDLDEVRRRVEERFGPGALERTRAAGACRMTVARPVKRTLEQARREAAGLSARDVRAEHVLLALALEPNGLAASMFLRRGISTTDLRAAAAHGNGRR